MKAAIDMLGVNIIMFLQMFILVTAIAYTDRNPLLVWGLILTSAKVDQLLQFGTDLGSRTSALSTLHSATAVGGAVKRMMGKKGGGSGSLGGVSGK